MSVAKFRLPVRPVESSDPTMLVLGVMAFSVAYLIVQRLVLSPIAGVPGPKLAAASFWYEFFYDVVKKGTYSFKIKELHKQHGPVIRINPYEVHIDDPELYDQIYVSAAVRPTDKWSWSVEMFQTPNSALGTVPHTLHRHRRAMFSNYLSTAAIHKLEALIQAKVARLMLRLDDAAQSKEVVSLTHAYSALTMDVITEYCFGKSSECLDLPDFAREFDLMSARSSLLSHFSKQFSWLVKLLKRLPSSVIRIVRRDRGLVIGKGRWLRAQVEMVIERRAKEAQTENKDMIDMSGHEHTIFDAMLDAKVPDSERSITRLAQEAQVLSIAGTLTTAHTLMTISYHLLANPPVLARLQAELANAKDKTDEPNPRAETNLKFNNKSIPLKTLESLPYLTATIREGLRMGYGVPHRLQRISPTTSITCHGHTLPPGTPISMSAMLMHDNETIFPDHETFNPDRWLPLSTNGARLNRYLVPFSKGSRACAGINLAWAELYLTIAAVFGTSARRMAMVDTVFERDVKMSIDAFNPLVELGSRGLQVLVEQ